MNNNIEKLKELIDSHNNIVFFGGQVYQQNPIYQILEVLRELLI